MFLVIFKKQFWLGLLDDSEMIKIVISGYVDLTENQQNGSYFMHPLKY